MHYFGSVPGGGGPVYENTRWAFTPVGAECLRPGCPAPPIEQGQRGFILMDLVTGQENPIHRRCLVAWVLPDMAEEMGEDPADGPL